jgi:hypothetical protein
VTWMRLVHSSCTRPRMRVVMAAFLWWCEGGGGAGGGEGSWAAKVVGVRQGSEACCYAAAGTLLR